MMNTPGFARIALAFVAAVILTTLWGAVVQTQFNLTALAGIDMEVDGSLRMQTVVRDIFSGFTPTYGLYIVAPTLLVAFLVAEAVVRLINGSRWFWYALAGLIGMLLAIPLVNYLAPVALLVGATRDPACTVIMAAGGTVAGVLFVFLLAPGWRQVVDPRP